MFITERMQRVSLLLPRGEETRLWERLGRFGQLQPSELREVSSLRDYLSFVDLGELSGRLREIAGFLGLDLEGPLGDPEVKPLELEELERELERLKGEMDEARERLQRLRERQRGLERELDRIGVQRVHLELLRPLRIDIGALQRLERFIAIPGTIPRENLNLLEVSLRELPHALLVYRLEHRRAQLVAVARKEDEESFLKVLEAALFQPLELPALELEGLPEEALEALEGRERELREQLSQVGRELEEFERWRARRRAEVGDLLRVNAKTLEALERTGRTREVAVAVGWVPARELRELERIVQEEPRWVLRSEPMPYHKAEDEYGPVPSALRNPPFFRAFEALVNIYGAPRYGGFDPTIIFALLFILIFGMMFGDLGHGLVLLLVGLGLRFRLGLGRPGLERTGTVLAAVGGSSMVFGTLYGSFFGYEHIIPALWFHPMEHIDRLLVYAVTVGVGAILTGIFINIAIKVVQGRYTELVFERSGVLGLWFYLGALVVVFLGMRGGGLGLLQVFLLMFLPLLLMPLERVFAHRGGHGGKREREGGFAAVVTAAVDVLETVIVYLSNSISFVRVAAFALNHVALSLAIFQLGAAMRELPLGSVLYILIVGIGNLIILILEGGIVAIQTLRLEFYEFFSKFFQEEGRPFRPFQFVFENKTLRR